MDGVQAGWMGSPRITKRQLQGYGIWGTQLPWNFLPFLPFQYTTIYNPNEDTLPSSTLDKGGLVKATLTAFTSFNSVIFLFLSLTVEAPSNALESHLADYFITASSRVPY